MRLCAHMRFYMMRAFYTFYRSFNFCPIFSFVQFFRPAALAAAMTPDLLGMMLNPGGMNQSHIHHPHHHHHPHAHQSHMAPLSPEDLEHAIRKARYEEARLKNYMDENMYSQQPSAPPSLSPSYLNPHHPHHHHQQQHQSNNNGQNVSPNRSSSSSQHPQHHMVLPGKSEITIGIVGSPGNPNHHNHHNSSGGGGNQETSPRSATGNGLTITAIPSPNNPNGTSSSAPSQNANSSPLQVDHVNNLDNGSPNNSSGDLYNRPRSTSSNLSSGGRCGADLVVPYIHSASHHLPHHSPYHHHHHPHHHHHSSMANGYDTGVGPLIHPGAPPALSHA